MHDLPLAIGFLQPANDQGAAATCIVHYFFPGAGVAGAFSAVGALGFGWITMRTLPPSGVLVPLSEFSILNTSLRLSYEMKAPLATSVTLCLPGASAWPWKTVSPLPSCCRIPRAPPRLPPTGRPRHRASGERWPACRDRRRT